MLDNEAVFNVSRRRLEVKHQRVPVARADHYLVGLLLFMLLGLKLGDLSAHSLHAWRVGGHRSFDQLG